jgi:hypothetical protein
MENQYFSKIMRIGLIDAKLSTPIFFEFNLNNILPTIKRARIHYVEYFMAQGPFRRQPVINVIIELPNDRWRYVRSWIRIDDQPRKILELTKDVMGEPQKLILEIIRTRNECEKLWIEYIEQKIMEFEKTLPEMEKNTSHVLQFVRR